MWGRERRHGTEIEGEMRNTLTPTLFTSSKPRGVAAPQRGATKEQPVGLMNESL